MRIGVISDTHGLIRPEALTALAGSELIIHAGDVGDPAVLVKLRTMGISIKETGPTGCPGMNWFGVKEPRST